MSVLKYIFVGFARWDTTSQHCRFWPLKTAKFHFFVSKTANTHFHDQCRLIGLHKNERHTTTTNFTMGNPSRTRQQTRPLSAEAAAELAQQRADQKKESQTRKRQFLIFIKALMRDLHQMDPAMHARAKKVIQDCTEKKKRRVPGFDFETTMRTRLLAIVGESNWRRVERDLHRRTLERTNVEPKRQHRRQDTDTSLSSHTSTASISLTSDELEPAEARQEVHERAPSVTLSLNDLSLHDGSVEVEMNKCEMKEAEAKVEAFVESIAKSRPPSAVIVEEEPRYIYI